MRLAAGVWTLCWCAMLLATSPSHAGGTSTVRVALSEAGAPTSYIENGKPAGLMRELVEEVFALLPGYHVTFHTFPWTRSQRMVEDGTMDLLVTFPSASRALYAVFTEQPIHIVDYGTIVYDRTGSKAARIMAARSFEEMKPLVFLNQDGAAWEQENVPAYIRRYQVNGMNALLHMTFLRRSGDFFIMNPEMAVYYARKLGYEKQLGMKKVDFIPNSQVPFHIGLRRSHPDSKHLLAAIEAAMARPEFLRRKHVVEQKYFERWRLAAPRG